MRMYLKWECIFVSHFLRGYDVDHHRAITLSLGTRTISHCCAATVSVSLQHHVGYLAVPHNLNRAHMSDRQDSTTQSPQSVVQTT
jgi:hypothetical protein